MEFETKFNKTLIIDGSYLLNRSLRIPNLFNLRSSNGQGTGGILQFLRSLQYEFKKTGMYFPVVCWDNGLSKRRTDADPNYKHYTDRLMTEHILVKEDPKDQWLMEYRSQRSLLIELLSVLGIPSLMFKGWEGDDLIYTMTKLSNRSIVLTDDRDMIQLVTEKCSVRRPMADEVVDFNKLVEDYGSQENFVKIKAINGDGSDNIPGCCPGVGPVYSPHLLKIIQNAEDDSIFESESSLKSFIEEKKLDIKYRKAYMNFNRDRYNTNLNLVSLDLVKNDLDDYIITGIVSEVENCDSKRDYFSAVEILGNLEISAISADEIIENVSRRYPNLKI